MPDEEKEINDEIEKIANMMVHDGVSTDEQDPSILKKYIDQIKTDYDTYDNDKAMALVYETLLYRKLKNTGDSGSVLDKGSEFGAGFS